MFAFEILWYWWSNNLREIDKYKKIEFTNKKVLLMNILYAQNSSEKCLQFFLRASMFWITFPQVTRNFTRIYSANLQLQKHTKRDRKVQQAKMLGILWKYEQLSRLLRGFPIYDEFIAWSDPSGKLEMDKFTVPTRKSCCDVSRCIFCSLLLRVLGVFRFEIKYLLACNK